MMTMGRLELGVDEENRHFQLKKRAFGVKFGVN
jgi:hypothetical protein